MRQILPWLGPKCHVIRDKATLAQVIIMPVVQLIVLANAATFTIRDTPAYVVDLDRSPTSRGLVNRITGSGHFFIAGSSVSSDLCQQRPAGRRCDPGRHHSRRLRKLLVKTGRGTVQLAVNGEKGSTAGIVQSYAANILAEYARELSTELRPSISNARQGSGPPSAEMGRIEPRLRSWYNQSLNYQHYMVPGPGSLWSR